ncbi:AAA family ATPase [Amycolatopsis sp. CA-126428]|uniref:AAA family ATPase n=1 Tax=Amycolatopsis sp. CA-126428 TaxID=2073158 RepID=UPI000CD07802|nr:ATP-binding protein [Amycolatopsis sp. CA-126428]
MPETDGVTDALLERNSELDALDLTLRGLAAGRGGVVVIEGAAGVGKSTLLRHVRAAMGEGTVLWARGAELERDFTFGAVQQLFGPVLAGPDGAELLRGPHGWPSGRNASPCGGELSERERRFWRKSGIRR